MESLIGSYGSGGSSDDEIQPPTTTTGQEEKAASKKDADDAKMKRRKTKKKKKKRRKRNASGKQGAALPSADSLLNPAKQHEIPDFLAKSIAQKKTDEREAQILRSLRDKDVGSTEELKGRSGHNEVARPPLPTQLSAVQKPAPKNAGLSSSSKRKWKPKHGFDALSVKTNSKKKLKGDGSYDTANIKTCVGDGIQ